MHRSIAAEAELKDAEAERAALVAESQQRVDAMVVAHSAEIASLTAQARVGFRCEGRREREFIAMNLQGYMLLGHVLPMQFPCMEENAETNLVSTT